MQGHIEVKDQEIIKVVLLLFFLREFLLNHREQKLDVGERIKLPDNEVLEEVQFA